MRINFYQVATINTPIISMASIVIDNSREIEMVASDDFMSFCHKNLTRGVDGVFRTQDEKIISLFLLKYR